jgi:hypothetical protein
LESLFVGYPAKQFELLGGVVLFHSKVFFCRLQILSEGHDVHPHRPEIVHALFEFFHGLPKPHHKGSLGPHTVLFLVVIKALEGLLVARTDVSDLMCQAFYGFHVLGHHKGFGRSEDIHVFRDRIEIRYQGFYFGLWMIFVDPLDHIGEMTCAMIREIVPIYGSKDDILQVHHIHHFTGVGDFFEVEKTSRVPRFDMAESAAPGTDVSQDHDGGGPLGPALVKVGTGGFFADRVEAALAHVLFDVLVVISPLGGNLQPLGFPQPWARGRSDGLAHRIGRRSEIQVFVQFGDLPLLGNNVQRAKGECLPFGGEIVVHDYWKGGLIPWFPFRGGKTLGI